ncbi:MAG: rhodanese-like domain-containing protein [Thermodesulfovibrionales bacterium]|nr:rhodanese-like domain-containing protein [Thermodesulfovibrionales bacterium]
MCNYRTIGKINPLKYHVLPFILLFVLLHPVVAFSSDKAKWQWIGPERVHDMLKEGSALWLIDVRNEEAYKKEHIESSVNIQAVSLAFKKFPRGRILVIVDDSLGIKAAKEAADILVKNGYEKVYILQEGIASWRAAGYSVADAGLSVKGVSANELKWALSNKVPLKIFDMRDKPEIENGKVSGSEPVAGKDIKERLENLRGLLKKREGKDLSAKLKKPQTIVLVFSASDDIEKKMQEIMLDSKADVRYLIGGYETFAFDSNKHLKMGDSCPTCPEKKK